MTAAKNGETGETVPADSISGPSAGGQWQPCNEERLGDGSHDHSTGAVDANTVQVAEQAASIAQLHTINNNNDKSGTIQQIVTRKEQGIQAQLKTRQRHPSTQINIGKCWDETQTEQTNHDEAVPRQTNKKNKKKNRKNKNKKNKTATQQSATDATDLDQPDPDPEDEYDVVPTQPGLEQLFSQLDQLTVELAADKDELDEVLRDSTLTHDDTTAIDTIATDTLFKQELAQLETAFSRVRIVDVGTSDTIGRKTARQLAIRTRLALTTVRAHTSRMHQERNDTKRQELDTQRQDQDILSATVAQQVAQQVAAQTNTLQKSASRMQMEIGDLKQLLERKQNTIRFMRRQVEQLQQGRVHPLQIGFGYGMHNSTIEQQHNNNFDQNMY
jgi:hypothetical protein